MLEGVLSRLLISKPTHFKSNERASEFESEMLNSVSKCAQHWQKASIHMSCLSTNYEIIYCLYTSYQVLVVIYLTIKFWLLSEALDFNHSTQDYQQSGF